MRIVHIRRGHASASLVSALIAVVLVANAGRADFKVKLPDAEPGEFEVETVGSYGRSSNPATNNEQSFVHEIEYGFNNFWKSGLEFETGRDPGPRQPSQVQSDHLGKLAGVRRARPILAQSCFFH
jgi:hypothetical protein